MKCRKERDKFEKLVKKFKDMMESKTVGKEYTPKELEKLKAWAGNPGSFIKEIGKIRRIVRQNSGNSASGYYLEAQKFDKQKELRQWYDEMLERISHKKALEKAYQCRLVDIIVSKYGLQDELVVGKEGK